MGGTAATVKKMEPSKVNQDATLWMGKGFDSTTSHG